VALKASHCRLLILLFLICFQACASNVGLTQAHDTALQETPLVLRVCQHVRAETD
jgi:hypothetical protein